MSVKCNHCGSENVTANHPVYCRSDTSKLREVGLAYNHPGAVLGTAQHLEGMLAELCQACGTVVRLYVPNLRSNWETNS